MKIGYSENLSDQIVRDLRARIFDGRLAPGERVNEVQLAIECAVSRSPLREALTQLTTEGAIAHLPRRGFFVNELTTQEACHIYPIRAALDPAALRLAGIPSDAKIAELRRITNRLQAEDVVRGVVELDDRWHFELWGACGNPVLIDLIEQFMRRTRRYELVFMADRANVEATVATKTLITRLLQQGDLDVACATLSARLSESVVPVCELLRKHQGREEQGHKK